MCDRSHECARACHVMKNLMVVDRSRRRTRCFRVSAQRSRNSVLAVCAAHHGRACERDHVTVDASLEARRNRCRAQNATLRLHEKPRVARVQRCSTVGESDWPSRVRCCNCRGDTATIFTHARRSDQSSDESGSSLINLAGRLGNCQCGALIHSASDAMSFARTKRWVGRVNSERASSIAPGVGGSRSMIIGMLSG